MCPFRRLDSSLTRVLGLRFSPQCGYYAPHPSADLQYVFSSTSKYSMGKPYRDCEVGSLLLIQINLGQSLPSSWVSVLFAFLSQVLILTYNFFKQRGLLLTEIGLVSDQP